MLNKYMSLVDPIRTTPQIPGYYSSANDDYYALNFGKKRKLISRKKRTSGGHGGHIYKMAKAMGVKLSSGGKRKTVSRLWSNIYTRGKSLLKKNNPSCKHTRYLKKHIKSMASKLSIKQRGRSPLAIWNSINASVKKQLPKKRKTRSTRRKRSGFGTWYDNTQKDYSAACASGQCASALTLGGPYPFYRPVNSDWRPYSQIKAS